ncbi:MAG: phosphate ABC transporter substrate-binding/OmpA family protein [Rhodobacteraceae bacterium]|nr:phosphate ABC transporter substrate-binding/OmpA family protein [Paracoccaceae bacterium]
MFKMKAILATTSACLMLGLSAAQAQTVTLRSQDMSFSMTGTLADFDGENYILVTSIGKLTLSIDAVTCDGDACPDLMTNVDTFSIAGSSTIGQKLLPQMMDAYAFSLGGDVAVDILSATQVKYTITDQNGDMYSTITLDLGNSDDAFSALESGAALVGMSSRRVTDGERSRFLRLGKGNLTSPEQEKILALDGLAVSVNPDNPIQTLSLNQISDIFSGNIRNWREVGGLDATINIYRQDERAGATQVFEGLVMEPNRQLFSNSAFIQNNNADVADAVIGDENGIGIVSLADIGNSQVLSLRSACNQVASPTGFSLKTEEYPMSRRMYLYVDGGNMPDKVAEFIDFLTSNEAQDLVERSGFVSQNVVMGSLDDQGRRLAHALIAERDRASLELLQEMVASLLDAERISLTFRFKSGSVEPDNRAVNDIQRLAEMVRRGEFDGKRLVIIGFADSIGAINENQRLSQARAESVRDVLVEAVGVENQGAIQFTPIGYGKLSPIGCNETEDGRDTNRRVEIWVR